jgi:hypothetical protein
MYTNISDHGVIQLKAYFDQKVFLRSKIKKFMMAPRTTKITLIATDKYPTPEWSDTTLVYTRLLSVQAVNG